MFGIAKGLVLQRDELLDPPALREIARVLSNLERLLPVGDGFLVAAEQRAGGAAVVIELCEFGARQIAWRRRVGIGLARGDFRLVGLLVVEDRGDVGDSARRGDENRLH